MGTRTVSQCAARIAHRLHRQVARIGIAIAGMLHAIAVDGLREIALPVQQPDGDEIQLLVAGCLAMVAGEDAQAAGVDRKALVESVLRAEIGDQRLPGFHRLLRLVAIVFSQRVFVAAQVGGIGRGAHPGPPG